MLSSATPKTAKAEDASRTRVQVLSTPDGGIQPQAAVDARGNVHLVFYKGDPAAGDLFYARLKPGEASFSTPFRVNSQDGSAIAMGTIRGAQIAVGKSGRVHVAWNGSGRGKVANPNGGSPMLYARLNDAGSAFERERNLMIHTTALDGGGTIAADGEGRVFVAWHGRDKGDPEGEDARRFFISTSVDEGRTFSPERPAIDRATGACGCCGSRAFVDRRGDVLALYRAATGGIKRDMILIASKDHGGHFDGKVLHPWSVNMCPMSSETFAEGPSGVVAAWETEGRVFFAKVSPETSESTPPMPAPGRPGGQKHPALAVNRLGETILVWAEGTGWARDGALAWQVFDAAGKPTADKGRISQGIPVWGLATVVSTADGGFLIIH
ncbi:MAG: hypothetical protein U0790_17625 [Isosphaeraceae bacterium]